MNCTEHKNKGEKHLLNDFYETIECLTSDFKNWNALKLKDINLLDNKDKI